MKAPLSPSDLERLQVACRSKRVDPARSLFGPDSVTWKVNRETVLLLGGGRALLMQLAHPLVAAGVAAHSRFREQPLQRLWQTLDLTLTIVFADAASALRAVRAIERVHARVHGRLETDVGPFPRGSRYDANDPALLFWVHATLLDSALTTYEQFVAPLSTATRRRYYEESKISARLFGIPERFIPGTLSGFRDYMRHMIEGNTLAVGRDGREAAASILSPPLPLGLKQTFQLANLFTVGLLPPPLRERYGFGWSRAQDLLLRGIKGATGTLLPLLPQVFRSLPHARRATPAPEPRLYRIPRGR
jgi:uncharacterized protein (DUF2236 family)